ncbi:regulator of rDNA transcription 14 [Scheffersomyces amazonensis]|uniref:regulator of rDNA transcription 14 n=1 Tax=Scheffersomyces amazonensis TaxID=1078765 RepID=UPI00315D7C54
MSFKSESSRFQAEAGLNRLLSNIIPSSSSLSNSTTKSTKTKTKKLTSTQLLSNKLDSTSNDIIDKKKIKKQRNSKIKKRSDDDKKFQKFLKFNIIKNRKIHSEEETKYLQKLVRKNINQIKNVSDISDFTVQDELDEIRGDLVDKVGNKQSKRLRKKRISTNSAFNDFDEKVKKGFISYPGLTPGLAPVDYNEEDSD